VNTRNWFSNKMQRTGGPNRLTLRHLKETYQFCPSVFRNCWLARSRTSTQNTRQNMQPVVGNPLNMSIQLQLHYSHTSLLQNWIPFTLKSVW